MVSMAKRMRYVSENEYTSSEGEAFDDGDYQEPSKKTKQNGTSARISKPSSNQKWLSKNAIMARENRLKKKMYVNNLESQVERLKNDNDKYTKIIDNQSLLIKDLRHEIKYLKSVIANSSDISNLIRNIHQSTGMSVRTSLDETLSLNNVLVSKRKHQPIAKKTAHPWEEPQVKIINRVENYYPSFPTPESGTFYSPEHSNEEIFSPELLDDDFKFDDLMDVPESLIDVVDINNEIENDLNECLSEHNYTSKSKENFVQHKHDDDDVGVCLHVSKHKVSLEFCSTCSGNASKNWKLS